jgi:uncharacterized protein YndB with AHSA1/START domain
VSIEARLETTIGRNAQDVFGQLAAVELFPEWLVASGVVRVERLDPGPLKEGSRLRIEQRIAGRATTLEGKVSSFEPGSRFGFQARDRDGISVEVEALLAAEGATCRLRWSLRLGLPLRFRLFESMAAPEVRRAAEADLQRLKQRLEAVAG